MQPGGHGGVTAEGISATVGRDERVLEGVAGLLGIAGRAQGDGPEPVAMAPDDLGEGVGIARAVGCEELGVGRLAHAVSLVRVGRAPRWRGCVSAAR